MSRIFGFDLLQEQVLDRIAGQIGSLQGLDSGNWPHGDTPIEKLFSLSLYLHYRFNILERLDVWFPKILPLEKMLADPEWREFLLVSRQVQVGDWRVDFMIHHYQHLSFDGKKGEWQSLIVECDGHEFHERTKEQAARDRSRDRRATSNSVPIFRFTGSELWGDPLGCAKQVADFVKRWSPPGGFSE